MTATEPVLESPPLRPQAVTVIKPLRVMVHDDSELVSSGLESMLVGHHHQVQLVSPAAPHEVLPMCDLELYDPAYVPAGSSPRSVTLPRGRMVAYSWDCSRDTVATELARGAAGYISKRASAERLVLGLLRVASGRVVVDVAAPRAVRGRPVAEPALEAEAEWPLTQRETEVLALITQGRSNQEIADELTLSINSIKSYIRAAYRKIEVTSRSHAVLWGVRHGLLNLDPSDQSGTPPAP